MEQRLAYEEKRMFLQAMQRYEIVRSFDGQEKSTKIFRGKSRKINFFHFLFIDSF